MGETILNHDYRGVSIRGTTWMIFNSKPLITQYFGENPVFYSQYNLFGHEGIDLVPTEEDWDVHTFVGGKVMRVYHSDVYGHTVMVHSAALRMSFRYAHLSYTVAKEGDRIPSGEFIGQMGSTPNARLGIDGKQMGAHLHINCIPMTEWGIKDFQQNGFNGRVDPLGVLRFLGEL